MVGLDPATTAHGRRSDETGIVVVRRVGTHAYVLDDQSGRMTPNEWGTKVIEVAERYGATTIVAETSIGGDLVAQVLRTIKPSVHVTEVKATQGKATRAEPVAALYEQRRVWHCGAFPKLEDQLVSYDPNSDDPLSRAVNRTRSPDRMDALVWAITELRFHLGLAPKFSPRSVPFPTSFE